MFLGHFAVGLAAKRLAPDLSLGTLFLACQLADLIWPNLLLLGIEHVEVQPGATAVTPLRFVSYPFSHSLLALGIWAAALAVAHRLIRRSSTGTLAVLAGAVLSHWALDAVTHAPDLPLAPGGAARIGLGLWNSVPGTVLLEATLFVAALVSYGRLTRAADRAGSWGLWALVGFLALVFVATLLGPPPPSVTAVAWTTQAMWILVLWGYWIDRHRRPRAS